MAGAAAAHRCFPSHVACSKSTRAGSLLLPYADTFGYKASVLFGQGTGLEAQQLHDFPLHCPVRSLMKGSEGSVATVGAGMSSFQFPRDFAYLPYSKLAQRS